MTQSAVEALVAAIRERNALEEDVKRIGEAIIEVGQTLIHEPEELVVHCPALKLWKPLEEVKALARQLADARGKVHSAHAALSDDERSIVPAPH
jgi:hypothetical protein